MKDIFVIKGDTFYELIVSNSTFVQAQLKSELQRLLLLNDPTCQKILVTKYLSNSPLESRLFQKACRRPHSSNCSADGLRFLSGT
jgi:hypothetical protein